MTAPHINFINIKDDDVIKLVADQHFTLEFTADKEEYDYELWTDWETGKFHTIPLAAETDGKYSITLSATVTGMFKFFVRYKAKLSSRSYPTEANFDIHVDPEWVYSTIVYNVFLRAFGAPEKEEIKPGEGGTFADVIKHMDEFVDLGINALYLNPFHYIGDLYRKFNPNDHLPYYLQPGSPYSIKDPKSIDPESAFPQADDHVMLTDPKLQFKKLVDAAHKRGIRVIMDLVFNHTAHDFVLQRIFPEWFLYKENITSAEDPYIYFSDLKDKKPWGDPKHTVVPYDHGEFSWTDTAQLNWEYMLPPAPNDPPPNTSKKEMYEYFKSIPKYWIKEFGIDGFRCDVAYKIPSDFWRECIKEARQAGKQYYPENGAIDGEVIFIAESFNINIPELFKAGFSLVYGDYSNKLYTPETLNGYLNYMYNIGTKDFPEGARWFIFPECHDFHRTTTKLVPHHLTDEEPDLPEKEEMAIRGNISRWVITACLPGMPMVFTGFEKVEWSPVEHVSYSKINWSKHKDIYAQIKQINIIRKNHLALQRGEYRPIDTSGDEAGSKAIFAFARFLDSEVMFIVTNMDIKQNAASKLILPELSGFDPHKEYILKDLLTGKIYYRSMPELDVILEPGASHIFIVEQSWG